MDDEKRKNDKLEPYEVKPEDIRSLNESYTTNLNRVMDSFDEAIAKGESTAKHFIDKKFDGEDKQRVHESKMTNKLLVAAFIIFVMWCICMYLEKEEMAFNLLYLIFGAFGGAGFSAWSQSGKKGM